MPDTKPLKRILGTPTAWLIGMGVAIGSGIFRTPGEVAGSVSSAWLIIVVWIVAGLVVLAQGLVTAELATRFPRAGGEYVYLREAYGEFVAFFFGWAYTIFIIGAGAAAIAAALGDFSCGLFNLEQRFSGPVAAVAVMVVITVNAVGLRVGAGAQNALTILKIAALVGVIVVGLLCGDARSESAASAPATPHAPLALAFLTALVPALWPYEGTTDSVKMAEEIKDVRRTLPRAIIGSTLALVLLYVLVNAAMLRVLAPTEMARHSFVPGAAMNRLFGPAGRNVMLIVAILACLGSLSSTVLATIRVTFALARDRLTFAFMSRMSRAQAPVPALLVVGGFATLLVLNRDFRETLDIYFFAASVLFGLSYGSLIVFRLREPAMPNGVFRCPLGPVLAMLLMLIQAALAVSIAVRRPLDVWYTTLMLAGLALLYFVWKRVVK